MEFGYYPGCALHGSSSDYERSVRACLEALGVGLRELDDWICCGASAAHALNRKLALALPARNLALAERDGLGELLAPCPMCSNELIRTAQALRRDGRMRAEMAEIVELPLTGSVQVLNLIQVFQRVGLDRLREAVRAPLTGWRPACYYGCLLTRPPEALRFDDCEDPSSMEAILSALGAQPVAWNYRTECCGAGLTMADEEMVLDLAHKVLTDAERHGADCVVVACPMCHVNLDMKQGAVAARRGLPRPLPVYYLSDAVGLALGVSEQDLGIDRHFVAARRAATSPGR